MHPILPSDPYGWKTTVPSAIFSGFSCANSNDHQMHSKKQIWILLINRNEKIIGLDNIEIPMVNEYYCMIFFLHYLISDQINIKNSLNHITFPFKGLLSRKKEISTNILV